MKKKILLIVTLVCLLSALACAGIMSFAGDNQSNSLTVYYQGYSTPYIHYQVGNGDWTAVPGVAMNSSSAVEGFPYEITIDLGSADTATVCFNDGNNNWDNNNYQNYTFNAGTYTFANGTIQPYSVDDITIDVDPSNIRASYFQSYVPIFIKGGDGPYVLEYKFTTPNSTYAPYTRSEKLTLDREAHSASYTTYVSCSSGGEASFYVKVTDANGQVAEYTETYDVPKFEVTNIVPSVESPQLVGTEITLTAEFANAYYPKYTLASIDMPETYTITKKGSNESITLVRSKAQKTEAVWTPTEAGEYTIEVSMKDLSRQTSTYSIDYVIEENEGNIVTVYYKGFENPYIHYAINDEWTEVPGVAMTATDEVPGYKYKAVINIGDAEYITACFNDGNDNWDSNYMQNYKFFIGDNYYTK